MSKNILVTGASRGIGREIALRFAQKDDHIIINAKNSSSDLLELAEEIRDFGGTCHPILSDISDYAECMEMFEEIHRTVPALDVVINNVGISHMGLFTDTTPDMWRKIMATNLDSVYHICHLALPNMIHKKSGVIINISSIWGLTGASMEVAYSASKAGVHGFTKALAKELGPSHIRVNAIACGAIETSMNAWLSPEEKQAFEDQIALCRFGKPKEVADLAYFLSSDEASYLTGEIIRLDGGYC